MPYKTLYLGLDPGPQDVAHFPIIQVHFRDKAGTAIKAMIEDIPQYTHIIFTSKMGVKAFVCCLDYYAVSRKCIEKKVLVAIGSKTAQALETYAMRADVVAPEATQEGIVRWLAMQRLQRAYLLLPTSSGSRAFLSTTLMRWQVRHQLCYLYDTRPTKEPPIDIRDFDTLIFTSPSTVEAFIALYRALPEDKTLRAIGPITAASLQRYQQIGSKAQISNIFTKISFNVDARDQESVQANAGSVTKSY